MSVGVWFNIDQVHTNSSSAFHRAFSRMGRFSRPVRMVVVLMRFTVAVSA